MDALIFYITNPIKDDIFGILLFNYSPENRWDGAGTHAPSKILLFRYVVRIPRRIINRIKPPDLLVRT